MSIQSITISVSSTAAHGRTPLRSQVREQVVAPTPVRPTPPVIVRSVPVETQRYPSVAPPAAMSSIVPATWDLPLGGG